MEFLNDILGRVLFTLGDLQFTVGKLLSSLILTGLLTGLFYLIFRRWLPLYFQRDEASDMDDRRIRRLIRICLILMAVIGFVFILDMDMQIYPIDTSAGEDQIVIRLSTLLQAFLVLLLARLIDWLISKVLIRNYYKNREDLIEHRLPYEKEGGPKKASRIVQPVVYVLAALLVIEAFGIDDTLWKFTEAGNEIKFTLSKVLIAVIILLSARLFAWILTQIVLFSYYRRSQVNTGSQYAINQLLQYLVYVLAILIALESLGLKLTVIWGGAAALLVGIGLGLQQTFNDLISGVILLFERTVEVGDVVQIDGLVGTVKKIGVRTSMVETRDNITVIVPNSKLTTENVINWSHFDSKARFLVKIGIAYGSDTALVRELLLRAAKENDSVLRHPAPFVRFADFGNSSLDFELHFWSHEFIRIEDVRSQIRFEIDRLFREQGVTIPFPQRDVWFRNTPGKEGT